MTPEPRVTMLVLAGDQDLAVDDPQVMQEAVHVVLTPAGMFGCWDCDLTVGGDATEPDPPCAHVLLARAMLAEALASLLRSDT